MVQTSGAGHISTILNNRFYEGKAVYHRGRPDERVVDGAHDVPEEIRELWLRCQDVRRERSKPGHRAPRRKQQVYPLSGVLVCDGCGQPFHGISSHNKGRIIPRMTHSWRRCDMRPQSVSAPSVEREFAQQVLASVNLDEGWREAVLRAIAAESPEPDHSLEVRRIDAALANLRKQHLWGAVDDEAFKADLEALQRQRRALENTPSGVAAPNMDSAARKLRDLPALWAHPGVTLEQRRDLVRKVFEEVRLREGKLVGVKPQPQYTPLFAYSLWRQQQVVGGKRSA